MTCALALTGLCGSFRFDLRAPSGGRRLMASPAAEDGLLRDSSLRPGVTAAAPLSVGDALELVLFDDVRYSLVLRERMESPLGGESFLASVVGSPRLTAVVLQTAEGLTAEITDPEAGRVYTVVSASDGVTVRETNPTAGRRLPSEGLVPDPPQASARRTLMSDPAADQATTLIDVLVAFDRPAVAWANQNGGGITNFATISVQKMNAAIANTGFSSAFRFRLVGAMAVDADGQGDLTSTLEAATNGTGDWAPIRQMRNEVGADVVTVLIDTGSAYGTTGLGWSLMDQNRLASFSENAYNTCAIRSVAQSHTMTHETGHNLGAGHSDQQTSGAGPQLYSYSSGYYFTANGRNYHTIMAYGDDGKGGSYAEIPYFSSPNYTYEGVPVGDATHDNVRTIASTYRAASNWRAQVIPMSYDVYFSPGGGATFTDSIEVSLTPGKAGLPIRYTLDGSMPTLDSTLYTGPIVLTQTTTIRAVTVTDGVAGPVFEATYSASDLGAGVDAPQLVWRTSENYPWTFQTTNTFDGVDAVQSAWMPTGSVKESWLETEVTGPSTMSFLFRREYMGPSSKFSVTCDGSAAYTFSEGGYPNDWRQEEIEIPAGRHVIRFTFSLWGYYNGVFNGVYLDYIRFNALSRPPTVSPATTSSLPTATTFEREMSVTLTPPEGQSGVILYTTDGSDPAGESPLTYSEPIVLTRSTRLRAVFVQGGKDPSVEVGGYYLERHPLKGGEWTTDVSGARAAAAADGRLIVVLLSEYATSSTSKSFYPVATSEAFLSWAEANGIYLVTSDSSLHCDAADAVDWFWSLNQSVGGGSVSYATMYFVRPDAPDVLIGRGTGSVNSAIGSVTYDGTVSTLIAGIASVLGESLPAAPTTTADGLVEGFPASVELTNPNASGTIRYTLDGSTPTESNGFVYTEPLSIPASGVVLKASIWTDAGLCSPLLSVRFRTVGDVLGTTDVAWTRGGDALWLEDPSSPGRMRSPYVDGRSYSTWLQGAVSGRGRLVFRLQASSNSGQNTIGFSENGTQRYSFAYSNSSGTSRTVVLTNEVTSTGTTTFMWTYTVKRSSYNSSSNGAWLSEVRWIPEEPLIEAGGRVPFTPSGWTTALSVPSDWIIAFGLASAGDPQSAVREPLSSDGANGIPRYRSYLFGFDPDSAVPAERQLRVTLLGFDGDGLPLVGVEPAPNDADHVKTTILGKQALEDEAWAECTDADRAVFRFFRARVEELPE